MILVEDKEFAYDKVHSENLMEFYKSCGVTPHHDFIMVDFSVPSRKHWEYTEKALSTLICLLLNPGNVLIHCMGGSGRTGFLAASALRIMGVDDPLDFLRITKSSYVETHDQEN